MSFPRLPMRPVALLLAVLAAFAVATVAAAQVLPREVRQQILQAVVEVRPYDPAQNGLAGWSGSGTIISPDGFILTNYHVAGDLDTRQAFEWHAIFVTNPAAPDQPPQHTYWARFVAGDATHDLAILHIEEYEDESPVPAGTRFVAMPVGDSNELLPGDPLTVVGYPGISGSTVTFTTGIVSGWLGEDLTAGGKQWIKTDAKIARGNSGGAAFDENGSLVGIPTLLQQRDDDGVFEEQFYLRPVAIAWALIGPNVTNVQRVGGLASSTPTEPRTAQPATPENPLGAAPAAGAALQEAGTLAAGDSTLDSGEYYDVFELPLEAGVPMTVSLVSSQFDPYLGILAPDGSVALNVDDSVDQGLNVLEGFTAAAAGTYVFVVSSARPSETGSYQLSVLLAGAPPSTGQSGQSGQGVPAAGLRELGTLASGDSTLDSGEYYDTYEVQLQAGAPVVIALTSTEFDAYLGLLDPTDAVVLEIDDSVDQGLNVRESFTPASSGSFLVVVSSARPGESGGYELVVAAGGAAAPPSTPPSTPPGAGQDPGAAPIAPPAQGSASGMVGPLELFDTRVNRLAGSDTASYHSYYIDVPAGTPLLTVSLAGEADLDLFLKYGSEIASWADDGDWDQRDISSSYSAEFVVQNPTAGRWYLDVVLFGAAGTQPGYSLRAY